MRSVHPFVTVLALRLASASDAWAAEPPAGRIVLVEPANAGPRAHEVLVRARGELTAAGFEVLLVTTGDPPGETLLATASRDANAYAAISVSEGGMSTWVWAPGPGAAPARLRAVEPRSGTDAGTPTALAIRTVELLRASLAVAPPPAPAAPPPAASPPARPPAPLAPSEPRGLRVTLGFGLASLVSLDGLAPSYGPELRVGFATEGGLFGRAQIAGPLLGQNRQASGAHVEVQEELGRLEVGYLHRFDGAPIGLSVAAGLGVLHASVEGAPAPPLLPHEDDAWTGLASLGGGLSVFPTETFFLALDAAVVVTAPQLRVALGGETVGTLGGPSVLLDASLGLTF